jgi:hypothetical protein
MDGPANYRWVLDKRSPYGYEATQFAARIFFFVLTQQNTERATI